MYKLLLVEDDLDYGTVIQQYLGICGFDVTWFSTPEQVINTISKEHFDLAILDIMLPIKDGFTLSKEINAILPTLPFLFLTAKNQNIDRLMGLKLGADDYISKTCDPEELKLRIENILKRTAIPKTEQYVLGSYIFNPVQLKLTHAKETIRLTERERDLLLLLINYNGQVIPREDILQKLWPSADYFNGRSLDVFVTRLRKYLQHDDAISITSIRGIGFDINLAIK
ncbi:response regulator transcription factor [Myroides marinus]|uniref:response regulator transcription factor n=1 Tax=Myroides marinus TaxID=703342 RepID=UPI002575819F|nr:response regulator transcription factor [Myroides marinus]MDM1503582.1 response regulator transcription factor [Myroides marinus]